MHTNVVSSNYIIEANNIPYNPADFLYLYEKYIPEMYIDKFGNPFGLEITADEQLLSEPIIIHYLNVFKDFVKIEYFKNDLGTGWQTFSLIRSKLENGLFVHKDNYRKSSIVFPITFPQAINWHEEESAPPIYKYNYNSTIVFCNVGEKWHSVSPSKEPRLQFQLDCYADWQSIPEMLKNIN